MTTETIKRHIAAGVYDDDLSEIIKRAEERLLTVRKSRSTTDFGLGDNVVLNSVCGVNYLRGQPGVVVGKTSSRVVVKLTNPVGNYAKYVDGKWEASEIRVPPSVIDQVV